MSRKQQLEEVVDWLMREHYKFLVAVNGHIQSAIEETQHGHFLLLISTAKDQIRALESVIDMTLRQIKEYDDNDPERFDRT